MTQLYYIDNAGEVQGPVSPDQLQSLYRSGDITATTQVCVEGTEIWQPYCQTQIAQAQQTKKSPLPSLQTKNSAEKTANQKKMQTDTKSPSDGITKTQGTILIALLLIGIGARFWVFLKPTPKWEYQTLEALAETSNTAFGANEKNSSYKTVPDVTKSLNNLGAEGWEVVGVYLEHETAHPNFGKEDLVIGLQPNVRPQKLACILKRQKKF